MENEDKKSPSSILISSAEGKWVPTPVEVEVGACGLGESPNNSPLLISGEGITSFSASAADAEEDAPVWRPNHSENCELPPLDIEGTGDDSGRGSFGLEVPSL